MQPPKDRADTPPSPLIAAAADATSGAIAGGISRTLTSPLDVIKIRFQVSMILDFQQLALCRFLPTRFPYSELVPSPLISAGFFWRSFSLRDVCASCSLHLPYQILYLCSKVVQLEPTTKLILLRGSSQHQQSKYTGIAQATKDIIREEGIVGLWRGNVPALMMVMPYTSIQFMVLQKMKSFVAGSVRKEDQVHLSPALSFISGAVAGCAATVGSYPFDLLRTVLASQGEPKVYPNLRSAFIGILQARGILGLYAGLTPTLIEIFPYAGIQFSSYDAFKRWGIEISGSIPGKEGPFSHFTSGLAAGIVAKSFCHPLDVIKKRFQVEGLKRDPRYGANVESSTYKNVWDATQIILKAEGIAGFYKGLFPSLVKAAPASAITFVAYEFISDWLQSFLT